jgi:Na+/H+-dicarboxylate symporter
MALALRETGDPKKLMAEMMNLRSKFLKSYSFSILLICCILIGSGLGVIFKERSAMFKPFGTVFLNLLFTAVVPMLFSSLSSAVAGMSDLKRHGRIFSWMLLVFVITGLIASVTMVFAVKLFSPSAGVTMSLGANAVSEQVTFADQLVKAFTVADFQEILSKKNMLALILFSILTGLATSTCGEKGRPFAQFLISGNEVMSKLVSFIMLYAPIGLGAYFAYLVGTFGPTLLGSYFRTVAIYYPVALIYFFAAFSIYAFFAAGRLGVKKFWGNIIPTSLTAWATGSSVAAIPTNLEAAKTIGVPADIREVVIPIGATIHMDGSCLAAIIKIAVLFGLFNIPFEGFETVGKAICIAILSGVVISGIPAGGMLGELLIVNLYGFPIESLPIISMVGTLVDPPATMVNSVGDNVASMMVTRLIEGKNWLQQRVKMAIPAASRRDELKAVS